MTASQTQTASAMQENRPIYLDYQATTPCDPAVVEEMLPWFGERFGNSSSRMHHYGLEADAVVESVRKSIASFIGASSAQEIVFTSGATEADNMALVGCVAASPPNRRHLVISGMEHEAVAEPASWLVKKGGCSLTVVNPNRDGLIDPVAVEDAIRDDTLIVSVMHANNVVGAVSDIGAIGAVCRRRGVLFHTDAAQSLGKIPFDVQEMNVDLASVSAHKLYGPKGVGFLYLRRRPRRVRLEPLVHGGGQEKGMRPGTVPVALVAGLGKAIEIASKELASEPARLLLHRERLFSLLRDNLEGLSVNGTLEAGKRLPGNLSLRFEGVQGEELILALRHKVAISASSACASSSAAPSKVLLALGLEPAEAGASIRVGLGRFTTSEEVEMAADAIVEAVESVRSKRSKSSLSGAHGAPA